jgi:hypothetical protein
MKSMAGRMWRDEGGSSKAGLALGVVLVLALVVGAVEYGGFRLGGGAYRVNSAGSVAAQQQDSLRRSFVASHGAHPNSERPGLLGQQRAQLAMDAQNSPKSTGAWQVPDPSATATPSLGRQFGGLVFETLPQVLWEVLRALGQGVQLILG